MASTFSPIQALDYVKKFIKNMPIEQIQTQLLDDTSKYLWMARPWRWTLGSFPSVTLVASTQDYSVALPSDFLYLYSGYIYTPDSTSGSAVVRPIEVVPWLNTGGVVGQPHSVAITSGAAGGTGNLRTFPTVGTAVTTGTAFNSVYKKQSPTMGPSNLYTTGVQVFDDEWFWVYESGVLYYAYLYADDQRAGSAQLAANGQVQYTGQRGVFESNIQAMAEREKIALRHTQSEDRKGV